MKVLFVYKNGRQRLMSEVHAKVLQKLKHGAYQVEDVRSESVIDLPAAPIAQIDDDEVQADVRSDELEDMDLEQLHALAKERGVKVHHKAGVDKVRAALREAVE